MSNKGYGEILGGGYVQRTILWHALEEGVVTAGTLQVLSGCSIEALKQALGRMASTGLMRMAPLACTPVTGRRFTGYSLTKRGIDAAMLINEADVEFATIEEEAA
jgi:hypothetical protein